MNQIDELNKFQDKFRVKELLILSNKSWSWSVRPDQPTLGSGILSLNRPALHLSDVTPEEMSDLSNIVQIMEKKIKATFNHNIMNYLMLMMVDHHVHYHVIPRYDGCRNFAGVEWIDGGWPALPNMGNSQHKDINNILLSIKKSLKKDVE